MTGTLIGLLGALFARTYGAANGEGAWAMTGLSGGGYALAGGTAS